MKVIVVPKEPVRSGVTAAHPGANAVFASVNGDKNVGGKRMPADMLSPRVVVCRDYVPLAIVDPKH